MSRKDGIELQCRDCGAKFYFTDDEAKFYSERGLEIPKRCPRCRNIAKISRKETVNVLKKYGIIKFVDADTELAEGETEVERA
jgi:ribosomal protein L33